ncbi:MAG: SMP-30/gluconolactonase/LRE family protein [Polyangiaceae bacterium]|nr:SMP-30/gluconolactonase/LRE family protein [Polyangiaceae bacterium]
MVRWTILGVALALAGCSSDEGGGGSGGSTASGGAASGGGGSASGGAAGSGGSSTGGASGSGGSSTGGASGSGGSSTGGAGGSGGASAWVDPLAGMGLVEKVAGGFSFTEGPVWFAKTGKLFFSDIPNSRIHELAPPGSVSVFREPSGQSNGLGIDQNGLLVACEHQGRRVSRTQAGGTVVAVASSYQGKKLNSPNDVIVKKDGNLYFTDPPYGGNPNELGFQGVFRVDPSGALSLVSSDMFRPNGIALSPDEKTLYVTDSEQNFLRTYVVGSDGAVSGAKKFLDTSPAPDGMAVNLQGDLFISTQAGVEVYKADGTPLGTIKVAEQPANCTFGGADGKTLYITARKALYRVSLAVAGLP